MICTVIGASHVTAYASEATALENLPAADTRAAAIGMISTTGSTSVGLVRTTAEMDQAKADVEAKKAAEEAARKAAQEAARLAALVYKPTYGRTVSYSPAHSVTETIRVNGKAMGNFKLTFYCSCVSCSGPYGTKTASGARTTEGRTIAVDRRLIPLGSKVYIEGYGDFIAEDVGGAIKGNKIDIYLNDHSRVKQMGVKYADIFVMS